MIGRPARAGARRTAWRWLRTLPLLPGLSLGTAAAQGSPPVQIVPPVTPLVWNGADPPMVPLHVAIDARVKRLRIVSAGAQDATTQRVLAGPLLLCVRNTPRSCAGTIVDIKTPGPRQFWIRPGGPTPPSGVYSGNFTLVANDEQPGQTFAMTFNVTDGAAYWIGGILLLLGTLLGLLLSYGVPAYRNLLQAERPAAVLRGRQTRIVAALATERQRYADLAWPALDTALREVGEALQPATLATFHAGLGGQRQWMAILAQIATPVDTAALVAHVTELGERLTRLEILATKGIAATLADPHNIATRPDRIAALDRLAGRTDIVTAQEMLAAIRVASPANRIAGLVAGTTAAPIAWTYERIDVETARISVLWLVIAALLTLAVGLYVLMLGKPGFGRIEDFLYCLLWGLGFSVGAGTLPNMTAEKIRGGVGLVKAA